MRILKTGVCFALLWLVIGGCKDKIIVDKCNLSYEETELYLSTSGNVTAAPRISTSGRGIYVADPAGLVIDVQKGVIDVTQTVFGNKYSGSGQKYLVKYISLDNGQLCETYVTISGIAYRSGIYNINSQEGRLLNPLYNTLPADRVEFPSGNYSTNSAVSLVRGNNTNGENIIDLRQSVDNGLFGSGPIANGTTREVTIDYNLQDDSGGAANRTTVTFIYYAKREDIPKELLDELNVDKEYPRGGRTKTVPPSQIVVSEN